MTISRKKILFLLFLLFFIVLYLRKIHPPLKVSSRTDFILGTTVTLTVYDKEADALIHSAFEELRHLESILSVNKANTLIDQINHSAGIMPVKVDPDTFNLIQSALNYSSLTDGAFDLTIGPLVNLWHIGFPDAKVPSPYEIQEVLPLINYHYVQLDTSNYTVYLTQPHMALDLGGIAKGYAADILATLFKDANVQHALINLGGNLYTLGCKPDGTPWTIGVQDPFHPRGEIIGTILQSNQSFVTSGIYERYLEDTSGKKFHHILNPHTGYPYDNQLASVTIISETSMDGDALSTATFALGLTEGLAFIESRPHTEAIFITTDARVYLSSGIKNLFTLTSPDFTLCYSPY